MVKYLKNENEYYKWCINNKINYFIYSYSITPRQKHRVEFYPKEYNTKVNQYLLDGTFMLTWDNMINASKALHVDEEDIMTACKLGLGRCGGYRFEFYNGD